MISPGLDTSNTEPAKRGLRLLLLVALLIAGCATTEKPPEEELPPLVDRTAETDFRLATVEQQLRLAEEFEWEGKRALAVATIETAKLKLPDEYEQERVYLDVIIVTIWARAGEGQDEDKAHEALRAVGDAIAELDPGIDVGRELRLRSERALLFVMYELQEPDVESAMRDAEDALDSLHRADAYRRYVEVAEELAFQFLGHDSPAARDFAMRAYDVAVRLEDDELLLQTCILVAQVQLETGGDAEACFLEAYDIAYRISDMGWRNVVIATSVDSYFNHEDWNSCVRWGNRIRDIERGRLPSLDASGLYAGDYITLLAQYALAKHELNQHDNRFEEARDLALKIIAGLPETEHDAWAETEEKLRSGLLQPQAD